MTRRRPIRREPLLICCVADTHRLHREIRQVPDGDVLIHAGDICHDGESIQTLADFNCWLGELPHRLKLVVPGNHDLPLQADRAARKRLTNATLLTNAGIVFEGLRFWGSPVTPLSGGAFGMWYGPDRRQLFSRIPPNTDVLVTHGPPMGILDRAPGAVRHAGDPELAEALRRIRPSLHVFGHIHAAHGIEVTEETVFVNAALLGEDGDIAREPIVIRYPIAGKPPL